MHVKSELDASLPPALGAESEIRDAITNLVLNAVDAMPDGGTLTLRSFVDARTTHACIEVSDTGVGMSEQVRSRCLEPFYTTKGERGTGLGLAMVYGMVQRHNAELEIISETGAGTTVRIAFPAAPSRPSLQGEKAPEAVKPQRILIVDDDPLLLESLQETLTLDGHFIQAADGGQSGIDAFSQAHSRNEPFTIVVTDLGMPHIDGRAVAAAVKSISPQTPVILLTGWGHRLLADQERPQHVDRVLSKPPKLAELRGALAALAYQGR